jgi:hypothetical protein
MKFFKKKKEVMPEVQWEDFPAFKSLDETYDWRHKHLSVLELEQAKEKLFVVLREDVKIPASMAKLVVDHALGVKAMYNAGFSRDYIKSLLVSKKMVQELHEAKVKIRHLGKHYARASNTIFELKAKLALPWRREVDEGLKHTLNRIEKIQQQLMEKK